MTTKKSYDIYIGLDVHKDTISVALANPERQGDIRFWGNIDSEFSTVRRVFNKLKKQYKEILVCYEAGPCGYGLYHLLSSLEIECIVVAPSRIAKSPTDCIKNDHRDAKILAKLLRAGDLTCVWVPDPSHEAMRERSYKVSDHFRPF